MTFNLIALSLFRILPDDPVGGVRDESEQATEVDESETVTMRLRNNCKNPFLAVAFLLLLPLGGCITVENGTLCIGQDACQDTGADGADGTGGTGETPPDDGADDESGGDMPDACSEINVDELGEEVSLACADEMFNPCAVFEQYGSQNCQHGPYQNSVDQGYEDLDEVIPGHTVQEIFHLNGAWHTSSSGWAKMTGTFGVVGHIEIDTTGMDVLTVWTSVSENLCHEWTPLVGLMNSDQNLTLIDHTENNAYAPDTAILVAHYDVSAAPSGIYSVVWLSECDFYAFAHEHVPHIDPVVEMAFPNWSNFLAAYNSVLDTSWVTGEWPPRWDAALSGGWAIRDTP